MTSRLIRAWDCISQLFNVLIFDGDSNYSISGDAYRLKRVRLQQFIDWLARRGNKIIAGWRMSMMWGRQ